MGDVTDIVKSATPMLKKPYVMGGLAVLVMWGLYRLVSGGQAPSPTTTAGLATDPALVQAGMEYNLASKQLDVQSAGINAEVDLQKYLADVGFNTVSANNQSYLAGLNVQTNAALQSQEMTIGGMIKSQEMSEANALQSQGMSLTYENTWKVLDYNDKASERQRFYDLANYQAMIGHDIGKKQIKAQTESNRLGFLGGIAKMFF